MKNIIYKMDFDKIDDLKKEDFNEIDEPKIKLITPEMMIERMKYKNKIMRYKVLFPHILAHYDYKFSELDQFSIDELKLFVEELSIAVNTQNSAGLTKLIYFESVRILEFGGGMVGMKLTGLQNALKDNMAIHDILNEISLKYENDTYMAPEIRLCYVTAMSVLSLHKLNSSKNEINNFLYNNIKEDIKQKYSDL